MTQEQEKVVLQVFDLYCKTVLKNKARNLHKELARKEQGEIPIDELTLETKVSMQSKDQYDFSVSVPLSLPGDVMQLSDPKLAAAVFRLLPRFRDVLYLAYFMEYTDKEIGALINEATSTVTARRLRMIKKLKKMLVEIDEE